MSRETSKKYPRRAAALATLVMAGLLGAEAVAAPLTCDELAEDPTVTRWAEASRQRPFELVDHTRRQWLADAARQDEAAFQRVAEAHRREGQTLRVVALDLPPNSPLVEVTCALGRNLGLGKSDTLVVVSRVGMHASSPAIGYQHLRRLARQHNGQVRAAPVGATAGYAESILDAVVAKRRERHWLGGAGLICLLLGAVTLFGIWRIRGARR